jgi:hypothetical protein
MTQKATPLCLRVLYRRKKPFCELDQGVFGSKLKLTAHVIARPINPDSYFLDIRSFGKTIDCWCLVVPPKPTEDELVEAMVKRTQEWVAYMAESFGGAYIYKP